MNKSSVHDSFTALSFLAALRTAPPRPRARNPHGTAVPCVLSIASYSPWSVRTALSHPSRRSRLRDCDAAPIQAQVKPKSRRMTTQHMTQHMTRPQSGAISTQRPPAQHNVSSNAEPPLGAGTVGTGTRGAALTESEVGTAATMSKLLYTSAGTDTRGTLRCAVSSLKSEIEPRGFRGWGSR